MKLNVYTKDGVVKYVELNVDVTEFFAIKKALCTYAANSDIPTEDRVLAVMITEDMKDPENIELDKLSQKGKTMTKLEYDMYKEYNKKNNATVNTGMKFCDVLLIVFIVLKLCKVINWSWWWVLSPFWIPLGLAIILLLISVILKLIYKSKH